jgi:hypothetical protein
MSMEYWFRGRLKFSGPDAIARAREVLAEEGCDDSDENLAEADITWEGHELVIDARGSMPYACFETSWSVLGIYARYARDGEVVALNVEDGVGESMKAGSDDGDELSDEEVDELRAEYGWVGDGD